MKNELNTKIQENMKEYQDKIALMNKEIISLKEKNQQIETQKNDELIQKEKENNQLKIKINENEQQYKKEISQANREAVKDLILYHQKNGYSYDIIKELIAKHGDINKFNISGIHLIYSSKYFALCMQIRKFRFC